MEGDKNNVAWDVLVEKTSTSFVTSIYKKKKQHLHGEISELGFRCSQIQED